MDITDEDLRRWLREEVGLNEYRRVVRQNREVIVISKLEDGFSQELFAIVERLPELFDESAVGREYAELVGAHLRVGEVPARTAVWHEAGERLLRRLGAERGIDEPRLTLVLPGIESVHAVMDTILWSAPTIDDSRGPGPGETAEFEAFEASQGRREEGVRVTRDLFTRYYGSLAGRRVENYCPGAQFARQLVKQAWRICSVAP